MGWVGVGHAGVGHVRVGCTVKIIHSEIMLAKCFDAIHVLCTQIV